MRGRTGALWQPLTSAGSYEPRFIVSGEGAYVTDSRGQRLLDATAGGVACVTVGHGRTEIADAVATQLRELEYYCLFGYTHPKAVEFAEAIALRSPGDLNHVFFSNSGSEAVETALKMTRSYWRRRGMAEKRKIISLHRGYHGMNFGGISVGGLTENRSDYGSLVPDCYQVAAHDIDALINVVEYQGAASIAAIILEPVQGAGGVYPPPEEYLIAVRELCDEHSILMILDEVVCGFGRLGAWFGGFRYGVVADIMTLAKGLTSAYQPMGATVATDRIHEVFCDNNGSNAIEFMHGYTYSGHPAAAVAGLTVLDILEREHLVENARAIGAYLQKQLGSIARHRAITEVRGEGLMAAVELAGPDVGAKVDFVAKQIYEAGVIVRSQVNHLGIYPPLIIGTSEVDKIVSAIEFGLSDL